MKEDPPLRESRSHNSRWPRLIVGGCLLLILIALLLPRQREQQNQHASSTNAPENSSTADSSAAERVRRFASRSTSVGAPTPTAEEIVAGKVLQFGRNRRELVRAIARRTGKDIPPEVERFFDAIEAGVWEEIEKQGKALGQRSGQYEGSTHSPELDPFWPAVLDAYGVAEQAHDWPAQKLLDYGNAILDSLRPGMVYVGGTDPGRWIPELLNETSAGEQHIIVTQNAFADGRYVDFMQTLYGDRFATLTEEDSKRAFQEYTADAQKRLEHDQQFPDEPKQIQPGEDVRIIDGKAQVSGQIAVMAVNEKMLRMLMEKNPDASFAMEESYPFKSMFGSATPLGPIMELRVQDEQSALTRERAAQSVDYWRTTAQQLLSDSEAADSREVRMSYSKLVSSQAGLLLDRGYTAEAEQAFRLANEIAPTSSEAVFRYVNLLVSQNRVQDAMPIAENALRIEPERKQFRDLVRELQKLNKK
jgi:tetratricopeptide (TPR) repeat protein